MSKFKPGTIKNSSTIDPPLESNQRHCDANVRHCTGVGPVPDEEPTVFHSRLRLGLDPVGRTAKVGAP